MADTRYKKVNTVEDLMRLMNRDETFYRKHPYKRRANFRSLVATRIPKIRLKDVEAELKIGLYIRDKYKPVNRRYAPLAKAIESDDRLLALEAICIRRQVRLDALIAPGSSQEDGRNRAIIWFFMTLRFGMTHTECSKLYNRSLSTINYNLNRLETKMDKNPEFLQEMWDLVAFINGYISNYNELTNTKELSNDNSRNSS